MSKEKSSPEESRANNNTKTDAFEKDMGVIVKKAGAAQGILSDAVCNEEYTDDESLMSNIED